MAQVFISNATDDWDSAQLIIKVLVQAGLTVSPELSTLPKSASQSIQHELGTAKCVLVLWSTAAARSAFVQREIHLAIQAWSSDRLLLTTLDDTPLPVGLRDVSGIPLQIEKDSGTEQLITYTKAIVERNTKLDLEKAKLELEQGEPSYKAKRFRLGRFGSIFVALLAVFVALLAVVSLLVLPFKENPVFRGDVKGPLAIGDVPPLVILMALVLGAAIGAGSVWAWMVWLRARVSRTLPTAPPVQASKGGAPQVFVSYSQQDERIVDKLVHQFDQMGYPVYIDRQSTGSQRYASSIVRAIRTSRLVALMCSRSAFSSDHVIREIYVAGDCKKPFILFQLDATEFPDEVLYFVSGFPRIPTTTTIDAKRLRLEIARLLAA